MFFPYLGIYQDIINENDHEVIKEGLEHSVHQVNESGWSIG